MSAVELSTASTVAEFEREARQVMGEAYFNQLFGNIDDHDDGVGQTARNNVAAFGRLRLRPRVLRKLGERNLTVDVQGTTIQFPVMIAPVGSHMRAHPDGELASTRAANAAGTINSLSTVSSYTIEEVGEVAEIPPWFQLYLFKDRGVNEMLIRRAEAAGYGALFVTVDFLRPVRERRWTTDSFGAVPGHRKLANLHGDPTATRVLNLTDDSVWNDNVDVWLNTDPGWDDIEWLRSATKLPVVVKGIQTAEDARLCVEHGVDGLVVSNHGGHGLEFGPATLSSLPEVVEAAGPDLEVYFDCGIRHGNDVLKALALGARAVFVGRPMMWALAADGEAGVTRVLRSLRSQLDQAMELCGVADVRAVDPALVTGDAFADERVVTG